MRTLALAHLRSAINEKATNENQSSGRILRCSGEGQQAAYSIYFVLVNSCCIPCWNLAEPPPPSAFLYASGKVAAQVRLCHFAIFLPCSLSVLRALPLHFINCPCRLKCGDYKLGAIARLSIRPHAPKYLARSVVSLAPMASRMGEDFDEKIKSIPSDSFPGSRFYSKSADFAPSLDLLGTRKLQSQCSASNNFPKNMTGQGYAKYYTDLKYGLLREQSSRLFCTAERATIVFHDFSKDAKGSSNYFPSISYFRLGNSNTH